MNLTKEQLKAIRKFAKETGKNISFIGLNGKIGAGFWKEECGESVEGLLNWIQKDCPINPFHLESARKALKMKAIQCL